MLCACKLLLPTVASPDLASVFILRALGILKIQPQTLLMTFTKRWLLVLTSTQLDLYGEAGFTAIYRNFYTDFSIVFGQVTLVHIAQMSMLVDDSKFCPITTCDVTSSKHHAWCTYYKNATQNDKMDMSVLGCMI